LKGTWCNFSFSRRSRRVSKSNGKLYWYGANGEIIQETDDAGHTLNTYVFFGGKRIEMQAAGAQPQLYVEDSLGSSRIVTTNTGTVCYDADFTPDTVAHGAAAAGNSDLSTKDRVIGGAKVIGVAVVDTVGGELLGKGVSKLVGTVGSKLAPETTEALTKLLTPKEANIAKAESIVSGYSDGALGRSASKAETSIARHEELLKKAKPEQQRSIAEDIRKAKERLEAVRREQLKRN
jgi:hypothetical protein